ncbi:23S rRNA G2445 N2-methylase RlmL [Paenibacillus sp. UNC496MF]|uniref:methyltransferase domain-containing protein n=1 Tax=Paenibacillus sp. UNC496MF TaxID=1502753 RepID=UPI0008E95ADE|nr:methyltransferase domain-containing protein [Paenibacillus sp. UNC496MF]SFI78794.1 23S rRNA G2445 N2-methylase RlmL [Paenibacillus sp. UNC496MF]
MTPYFATVLPGLEPLLEQEIRFKLPGAAALGSERGKVFFASGLPLEALKALRTADNLYRPLLRFRVGPHKKHLADLEEAVFRAGLEGLPAEFLPGRGPVRFKVNAGRTGKHAYSRFDAAEAAARGIARQGGRWRAEALGGHEVEFRLDLCHDEALFAVRLTDAAYRYRGGERAFAAAALRPTVAHALVWASRPAPADRFLDPCCGSGTILTERLGYPYARLDGGDLSPEAVAAARGNAGGRERLAIRQWDARRLPIDAGAVDKAVTNLPFGRQISAGEAMPALYADLLRELKRVVARDGGILCLTDADGALREAAERLRLGWEAVATLSLKGLHPTLYRLRHA